MINSKPVVKKGYIEYQGKNQNFHKLISYLFWLCDNMLVGQ
jgi:hypothetical protein